LRSTVLNGRRIEGVLGRRLALVLLMSITSEEREQYRRQLLRFDMPVSADALLNKTIWQDLFAVTDFLPREFVDLLIVDPPYNLTKTFNGRRFKKTNLASYTAWLDSCLATLTKVLKATASIYVCSAGLTENNHILAAKADLR
jgi:site-specific DNA-methyltransferase (adenine-specific)